MSSAKSTKRSENMRSEVYQADWLDQAPANIDLRKSQSSNFTRSILNRTAFLQGSDRDFVNAMYRDGQSAAEIARIANLDPRQVRRKIKAALKRLNNPLFIFVVTNKAQWSPTRQKVAQSIIQRGRSIRDTAEKHNLKLHQVRRHRSAILEQYEEHLQALKDQSQPTPNRTWKYARNPHEHNKTQSIRQN